MFKSIDEAKSELVRTVARLCAAVLRCNYSRGDRLGRFLRGFCCRGAIEQSRQLSRYAIRCHDKGRIQVNITLRHPSS